MKFHLHVSENKTYRPGNGKKTVLSSFFFFPLCVAIVKKYLRVPEHIYMRGGVHPLKMVEKFSISSQLCFVQGLLLNS